MPLPRGMPLSSSKYTSTPFNSFLTFTGFESFGNTMGPLLPEYFTGLSVTGVSPRRAITPSANSFVLASALLSPFRKISPV
jgi:hypothetical protein